MDPESELAAEKSSTLWKALEDLEDGILSPASRAELMKLLEESAHARALYREYFELVATLQIESAAEAELGVLPIAGEQGALKGRLRLSLLAAAAVLVLVAVVAAFVATREPELRTVEFTVAPGSEFVIDAGHGDKDSGEVSLVDGSSVRVSSGFITFELETGVRMMIQGPAAVTFPELERPVVENGWLWVDSSGGETLLVETPGITVRDIGTRFAVAALDDGTSEVHLVEGEVEVTSKRTGRKTRFKAGGTGMRFGEQPGEVTLANDPFPSLAELLGAERGYRVTTLSQAPVGYWRLEEEEIGEVANELEEGRAGRHGLGVQPGVPGIRLQDGFGGFPDDNHAAYLPGDHVGSALHYLDGPEGVSPREGAVSFWFRREPGMTTPEMLWFAGSMEGGGLGPEEEMHAFLSAAGRVQFFMEDGKYDVLLSSGRDWADGNWHHVAAAWGERAVELFVDGKLVARDTEYRKGRGKAFSGTSVRFGKAGAMGRRTAGATPQFRGWVDEIAIWNRPLTPTEVRIQYRSALGDQVKSDAEARESLRPVNPAR